MASRPDNRRARQLYGVFRGALDGGRQIVSDTDARLFFEAVQDQRPPSACVEKIVSSPAGLDAVKASVRADLSLGFIVSHTLKFISYLSDPGIKTLAGGQLLGQMLAAIAYPPTLWNCLVNLCLTCAIAGEDLRSFAWLILELLCLPPGQPIDILAEAQRIAQSGVLLQATSHETRGLGHRILKVLQIKTSASTSATSGDYTPGGRHDNDHADFRDIAIYPTKDEFLSREKPFYRTAKEVSDADESRRASILIDNQYRLLREDLLAELREGMHAATGKKKNRRPAFTLSSLRPVLLHFGADRRALGTKPCLLGVTSYHDRKLQDLDARNESQRKHFLKDQPRFLKHQGFGVLHHGDEIYGFAFVDRDVDLLCHSPPVVLLQFVDDKSFGKSLLALKTTGAQFTLVDTPVFAYEPVLNGLKLINELPLHDSLLNLATQSSSFKPEATIKLLVDRLLRLPKNGEGFVKLPLTASSKPIELDEPQLQSLINALQNDLTLIQGPPGTGKSFLGARIANYLHMLSNTKILIISYTHHALDQFLEDLIKTGIPGDSIVRLGAKAKCTSVTAPLLLSEQNRVHRRSRDCWDIIDNLKDQGEDLAEQLRDDFNNYCNFSVSWKEIEEHLEFSQNDRGFYEAFRVPTNKEGWRVARGIGQQAIRSDYLYQRWIKGLDRGIFKNRVGPSSNAAAWGMPLAMRVSHVERWTNELVNDRLETLQDLIHQYNSVHHSLETLWGEDNVQILKSKRFIACTTTAAAKYASLIRQAEPCVVLVEEAGEILESHILTSLSSSVKQLILIGDHKQLRPKVNNFALTVEKGDGFDLNRSLFERLILQGANFTTLQRQHRMVPEISIFPRRLTYPELIDGPKTVGRSRVRGLQSRVIFVGHSKPEVQDNELCERRDPTSKSSKKNTFEAEMVLKCVRYMAQQGYGSEKMVVLTPYLGQLRELREQLQNDHDPVLNDMDASELIRAGLLTETAARINKKPLRISTIDNYQGEESDIVIASLTRSNPTGDIGFMKAPERLNVLLSRARDCLILIGNPDTFMKSPRGKDTWLPFFSILKEAGHLYDGLPVKCEQHPERTASLSEPSDFEQYCPEGGCAEPCGAKLKCGAHICPLRCHRVADHSKTECKHLVEKTCTRNHRARIFCSKQSASCPKCVAEDKEQERRIKRSLRLEEERLGRQAAYARELQEVQDKLDYQRRLIKYQTEEQEQKKTLAQAKADLDAVTQSAARVEQQRRDQVQRNSAATQTAASTSTAKDKRGTSQGAGPGPDDLVPGSAREDWELLKKYEKAASKPMDELMGMIGLEEVKKEFLSIKNKVDTTARQGLDLSRERFSCSLLGNPGTGKTTVARLYGQFLTSVGVLPGACFKETTGASLANIGVSGCKKLIEEILNDGGGVLFIDEAYQLVSGNNPGGAAVLDYLLPEVEDLRGKVVFVLAGYSKQMEAFFGHNPGLPSRFPIEMKFADYMDDELLRILEQKINHTFKHRMKCEDGLRGLYCRIVCRRIGRGRDRDGFGNARTVENTLSIIRGRQANRLRAERRAGSKPDDMLLVKIDLIGPEPSAALVNSKAWIKLQKLIGLTAVKEAVKSLVDTAQQNYQRELAEEPSIEYSLNKVFLGSPGTGKTTVAKLYGAVLVDLGMLTKGEVVVKNPSDFVGSVLGQSEQQTKAILAATVGKVLVIDEAYGLYGGGGGGQPGSASDPYKTAVIDTIVAEVQSVPGDDRCVLLLGYKDNMESMFQNVNPGLARRFPIASAFNFEDFDNNELGQIFDLKLGQQSFQATKQAKKVAMEMLDRARNRPNFGNAGEIDIILNTAKARHQLRFSRGETKSSHILDPVDFDEEFNRAETSVTNIRMLFEGTVGCNGIVETLEGYQETFRTMKELEMDPKESIPFNFLFRGPPGTGKTTTARKMGKVFFDMGFLATAEVVECSATDLVGQYVGQTGPKVQQQLDKALGKILFVDEAYRLLGGHFAKEAMDELVDSTTKERYHKRMIIILAGYEDDINQLMSSNPGLTSRFPEVIDFRALSAPECVALLAKLLGAKKTMLAKKGWTFDLSVMEAPRNSFVALVTRLFTSLVSQSNWANARDVETISKGIFTKTTKQTTTTPAGKHMKVEETVVISELESMLKERAARAASAVKLQSPLSDLLQQQSPPAPVLHSTPTTTAVATTMKTIASQDAGSDGDPTEVHQAVEIQQDNGSCSQFDAQRDASVSDAVWEQLQRDRKAEQEREEEYQRLLEARRTATEAEREKIVRRLLEEERRRKEEEEMRKKLAMNGLCPAGFNWIKQDSGFRCAGGSHFVSETQLASLK